MLRKISSVICLVESLRASPGHPVTRHQIFRNFAIRKLVLALDEIRNCTFVIKKVKLLYITNGINGAGGLERRKFTNSLSIKPSYWNVINYQRLSQYFFYFYLKQ